MLNSESNQKQVFLLEIATNFLLIFLRFFCEHFRYLFSIQIKDRLDPKKKRLLIEVITVSLISQSEDIRDDNGEIIAKVFFSFLLIHPLFNNNNKNVKFFN